jgi:hypothetical protein
VAWLPRTAVGEAEEPGRKDWAALAAGLAVAVVEGVAFGGALGAIDAEGFGELGETLGVA